MEDKYEKNSNLINKKITEYNSIAVADIKKIMGEIISAEDKSNPVNDDKLVLLMKEKGYNIARRTIAKYREQMGIPVARLRRNL